MLITAWWDVNRQFVPGHNPRRRRVRPLKELERFLGHRVRISGFSRYDMLPANQYQYTAYSWLDADSIDDAVMFTLRQLARTGGPIQFSPWRLNRWAIDSEEETENTIGSFYWNTEQQPPLQSMGSGGVLLHVTRHNLPRWYKALAPERVIRVPASNGQRSTYDILVEINQMGDPQDVRSFHLPRYIAAHGLAGFELDDAKWRPTRGVPSHLVLRRTLYEATESEAVCTALASGTGYDFQIGFGPNFRFEAKARRTNPDGLVGMSVTRSV